MQGKNNQRIIITGSSGTGKSTLAQSLADALKLPVIPEIARQLCLDMGYDKIGSIPDQEGFKQTVLTKQIATEEELASFISDRSTIDSWVLWQRWNICQAYTDVTENYYNTALTQAKKYTHIIYVPPMFPPEEDDFRWTNPDYQKQIDRLVRSTLYDWQLLERTYTITSTTVDERIKEVKSWLGLQ